MTLNSALSDFRIFSLEFSIYVLTDIGDFCFRCITLDNYYNDLSLQNSFILGSLPYVTLLQESTFIKIFITECGSKALFKTQQPVAHDIECSVGWITISRFNFNSFPSYKDIYAIKNIQEQRSYYVSVDCLICRNIVSSSS